MKYHATAALVPLALLLSACTTVTPAYKDTGTRAAPCVDGGPDSVAQQFYDLRMEQPVQGLPSAEQLAKYRPYLSEKLYATLLHANSNSQNDPELRQGDIFSSLAAGPTSARVADSSTIPNTDARNIPLRVSLSRDGSQPAEWQDEILMVREGTCWTVDDVRYASPNPHLKGGSLSQLLMK